MHDVLADPQLAHRNTLPRAHPSVVGRYVVEAMGLRFSAAPMQFTRPAPCLAADSKETYCGLPRHAGSGIRRALGRRRSSPEDFTTEDTEAR
jgi:crotonobetainyl-CoA:carnitine CoA-transferase CaiB-like acyl-CoA transferase